jgi:hypothetical protein
LFKVADAHSGGNSVLGTDFLGKRACSRITQTCFDVSKLFVVAPNTSEVQVSIALNKTHNWLQAFRKVFSEKTLVRFLWPGSNFGLRSVEWQDSWRIMY